MLYIQKKLTPYNYTKMHGKQNLYVVIHYVGAVSTAKNNVDYYARQKLSASAHYFVDGTSIWQSVEDGNRAWHCGGGLQGSGGHSFFGRCTNSNSIGIEMCCRKDASGRWYFEDATVRNTVELTKYLMKKYNIPSERVIRHYDVTGKICPEPYVRNEQMWTAFKAMLKEGKALGDNKKKLTTANDITWELSQMIHIEDVDGFVRALEKAKSENSPLYWGIRKIVNR